MDKVNVEAINDLKWNWSWYQHIRSGRETYQLSFLINILITFSLLVVVTESKKAMATLLSRLEISDSSSVPPLISMHLRSNG